MTLLNFLDLYPILGKMELMLNTSNKDLIIRGFFNAKTLKVLEDIEDELEPGVISLQDVRDDDYYKVITIEEKEIIRRIFND